MIQRIKNNAFAWNSLVLFSGTMVANVLNYIFHLVVGRMVSVSVYGEIEALISLITIISVPSLTLTIIATDLSSRAFANNDKYESYQVFLYLHKKVLKFGLPLFILAVLSTPFVAGFMNIDNLGAFLVVWLVMFLSFLMSITGGIINGWQKFKASSLVGVCGAAAKLIFAVSMITLGFQLGGALGGFAIASVVSYLASLYILRFIFKERNNPAHQEKNFDFSAVKTQLLPILIGNLAINILGNADMVLAKRNMEEIAAGQYGALTIVSKVIYFATGVIATVLFSMASQGYYQKCNTRRHLIFASYLILFVAGSGSLIYFFFPEFVLGLLFGDKYTAVAGSLGWFAVAVTLFSFNNLFFQYLLAIKRTAIVYVLLVISLAMATTILFYGTSIFAIIIIVTAAQAAAIIAESLFLMKADPHCANSAVASPEPSIH